MAKLSYDLVFDNGGFYELLKISGHKVWKFQFF